MAQGIILMEWFWINLKSIPPVCGVMYGIRDFLFNRVPILWWLWMNPGLHLTG